MLNSLVRNTNKNLMVECVEGFEKLEEDLEVVKGYVRLLERIPEHLRQRTIIH
jgi:hypothetical protein